MVYPKNLHINTVIFLINQLSESRAFTAVIPTIVVKKIPIIAIRNELINPTNKA